MNAVINPMDLSGSAVLVTGASSGIGRETAVLLSRLGARVVLVARNESRLNETLSALEGKGHRVIPFDLSKTEEIPAWIKTLSSEIGPFHGVVHAAGIQKTMPLKIIESRDVDEVMKINVTAALMLVKGFRQKGVHEEPGSVVLISSVMGLVGESGRSVYSATKGALMAATKSLALELAKDRIRVNCIAPSFVATPMFEDMKHKLTPEQLAGITAAHPMGVGRPIDVAYAVAYLLSETGAWVTGTTLVVDGGYTAR